MVGGGYSSWQYVDVYESEKTFKEFTYKSFKTFQDRASVYPFLPRMLSLYDIMEEPIHEDPYCVTSTIITNPLLDEYFFSRKSPTMMINEYKKHAVVELRHNDEKLYPENHRRNIKKCRKTGLATEIVTDLEEAGLAEDVYNLYKLLVERHEIAEDAPTNYSLTQIRQLLDVPGAVLFRTSILEDCVIQRVNYSLFFIDKDDVYYHLSAMSPAGYATNANFIMMDTAIKFFKRLGLRYLEIGATPDGAKNDGLRRFKQGFANLEMSNYIIKIVHNLDIYNDLCKGIEDNGYFPLYKRTL